MDQLTTLQKVKDWLGVAQNDDDLILQRLLNNQSRAILSYIERETLFYASNNDVYDGDGQTRLYLKYKPVLSVTSVTIDYQTVYPFTVPPVPANSPTYGSGWVLEPWNGKPPGKSQALSLRGYTFNYGQSNVNIAYISGYVVQNEAQTVPSSANYSLRVNEPYGSWGQDNGVTYASSGTALTAVTYNPSTSLSTGQYMVSRGIYYFAAGDAGVNMLITYSYVPSDIEQACIESVAERYRYRARIGEKSKTLAGQETISYAIGKMPDDVREMLQAYKNINIF